MAYIPKKKTAKKRAYVKRAKKDQFPVIQLEGGFMTDRFSPELNQVAPKKRAYKKRAKHVELTTPELSEQRLTDKLRSFDKKAEFLAPAKPAVFKDELDLLRDMLASFESLSEEGRYRAYMFFVSKHSRYGESF